MFFPSGSRATWQGDWNNPGVFSSPVGEVGNITSYLEANCNMAVESSSVTMPDVFSTSSTRTVTLKVRTLIDRNDLNDIDADIRHAWYVDQGVEPDASSIQQYTLAGQSGSQSTGAPSPQNDNGQGNTTNNPSTPSWWDSLKKSLGLDQLGSGLIGVGVGVVLVIGVLMYVSVKEEAIGPA